MEPMSWIYWACYFFAISIPFFFTGKLLFNLIKDKIINNSWILKVAGGVILLIALSFYILDYTIESFTFYHNWYFVIFLFIVMHYFVILDKKRESIKRKEQTS